MKKNKYTYVWVSLVILVFGIIFIPKILKRAQDGTTVENDRMSNSKNELSYVVLNNERRKVPDFSFINQDSLLISNVDYEGKIYIVEFFFATCPTICPIMNTNLVKVQNEFKEVPNLGIASFTINPENDTPSVLKAYAESYGIENLDWHLLTGDREAIYDLANKGFNLYAAENQEEPGGFEHSGKVALIDPLGYLRCRRDGFDNPIVYYDILTDEGVEILKEDIRKLLKEKK